MLKYIAQNINTVLLLLIAVALGAILMRLQMNTANPPQAMVDAQLQQTPTVKPPPETIPPFTPFSSWTPTNTLKPPPTFEPPTPTREPTLVPSITPTVTLDLSVSVPGLRGGESPTPMTTPEGCKKRDDWKLTYTVQLNDALATIAERFSTSADELAAGNCLANASFIVEGQVLRVPGDVAPDPNAIQCFPLEVLTPFNDAQTVAGEGAIAFNWRGPEVPRTLVRIIRPDGTIHEEVIELRQNVTVDAIQHLSQGGRYTWYVYPLDFNFQQTCPEGGPWTFIKAGAPTATPTITPQPSPTQQPNASFIYAPQPPTAGVPVQFASQAMGEITAHAWDFNNDGVIDSTARDPIFTFPAAGDYLVTYTVAGPGGTNSVRTFIRVN